MSPAEQGIAFLHVASLVALAAALATAIANRRMRGRPWPTWLRWAAELDFFVVVILGMIVGGLWIASFSLRAGREYGALDASRTFTFVIERVYATDPHAYFPSYNASGSVLETATSVTISVRPYVFVNMKPGSTLRVLRHPSAGTYVWEQFYREAAPFIAVGPVKASWRIVMSLLLLPVGALLARARFRHPHIVTSEHEVAEPESEDDDGDDAGENA